MVASTGSPDAVREQLLAVEGINISLGGRQILRDVSFRVAPGEFTGLIGSNGSGKTTLLRVILGLLQPDSGTVQIAHRTAADPDIAPPTVLGLRAGRAGSQIGYVPQKVLLDADMPLRARDVVELGLDGHRLGMRLPSRRRRRLVEDMLAAVDATRFADARVGVLSGGEQQRVLIAHALISRPRLVVLDEPLANLDLRSAHEVVALLARIAREQRIAVLLSAHEMNPLLPVTDRIVYLAGGRAAGGTVDEVITTEVLSGLYGRQVDVLRVRGRPLVVVGDDTVGDDPVDTVGDDAPDIEEPASGVRTVQSAVVQPVDGADPEAGQPWAV